MEYDTAPASGTGELDRETWIFQQLDPHTDLLVGLPVLSSFPKNALTPGLIITLSAQAGRGHACWMASYTIREH